MEEFWDLYNSDGIMLNEKIRRGDAIPEGTFHRIIHVWIRNEHNEFLIQKRAPHLHWYGGRWATTTGSIQSGAIDFLAEAYRELEEELSLGASEITIAFHSEILIGRSIISIFSGQLPKQMIDAIRLNDEVSEVRWMTESTIRQLNDKGEFAPYSDDLFRIVFGINSSF
jgi:isopentenyldiphosphate isomerase